MSRQTLSQSQASQQKPAMTHRGLLQRKCACGNHTMMGGECSECGKKNGLGLQTKLKVNEPGDIYEQEADRIADQVMATPAHHAVNSAPSRIQRFSNQSNGQMGAAPASVDHALASPGRPLQPALRQDMEQRFGYDFSRVRVHSGAAAEQSARDVNANAYTVGHHIVFGAGRYASGTHEGRRLIAHELTHVVQQGTSQIEGGSLRFSASNDASEVEADRVAANIPGDQPGLSISCSNSNSIQRDAKPAKPANPKGCDDAHTTAITTARDEASKWAGSSNKWLDAHLDHLKKRAKMDDGTGWITVGETVFQELMLLDKHFKLGDIVRKDYKTTFPDSAKYSGSSSHFQKWGQASYAIRKSFSGVTVLSLDFECEPACPKSANGADVVGSAQAGSKRFTIYIPCFDKQATDGKNAVVLHEAFHASFSAFDHDTYSDAAKYPGDKATTNADSYATFASVIATGSSFRVIKLDAVEIKAGEP